MNTIDNLRKFIYETSSENAEFSQYQNDLLGFVDELNLFSQLEEQIKSVINKHDPESTYDEYLSGEKSLTELYKRTYFISGC